MALIKITFCPSAATLVSCVATFLSNLCVHAKTYFFLFRGEVGRGSNTQAATSKKRIFNPQNRLHNNNRHNSDSLPMHCVHPATAHHSHHFPNTLLSVLTVTRPTPISPPATKFPKRTSDRKIPRHWYVPTSATWRHWGKVEGEHQIKKQIKRKRGIKDRFLFSSTLKWTPLVHTFTFIKLKEGGGGQFKVSDN